MVIAVDPRSDFDYVLEEDRSSPPEDQTTWRLGVLTAGEAAAIEDGLFRVAMSTEEDLRDAKVNTGSRVLHILKLGLRGWSNLKDSNGAEIPYETITIGSTKGVQLQVRPELLDRLKAAWRMELAEAIMEHNAPTEQDVKNS